MRDAANAIIKDRENTCFVCGNDRLEFETSSIKFEDHVSEYHNPWDYVYYMLYLYKVEDINLNGNDLYVKKKIE